MSEAFEVMKTELEQNKERWKQIQTRLVAEVERTNEESGRLKQAMASRNAETDKLKQERDAAVRCHRQAQAELGPLRLELSVAKDDLKKARESRDAQQKESDSLRSKLGKTTFLAQANLKKIVDKFPEQTNVAIQAATAMTLQ
jgi:predicted  nucleic acid-binding Zn-ribbon protein